MGTVWLLRRPEGAPFDTIYGHTRAVKTFNVDEDVQEAIIEQELGNWASLDRSHYIVLHLDLKPQNLLLYSIDHPDVKISDWGLSRRVTYAGSSTATGWFAQQANDKTRFVGGTIHYMAPERLSGAWIIGPAADVFSLGVIGIELMTGQVPTFDGRHDPVRLIKTHQYFKRAKELLHSCEGPLVPLMLQMLDPEPTRRPHDYPALISAVERI
jgi:serine/threonine protein kinase